MSADKEDYSVEYYFKEKSRIIPKYFSGEQQIQFAQHIFQIIQVEKGVHEEISMNFKTKKPLLSTEHYHKWQIEIKSSKERTRYRLDNDQMRYHVLAFIGSLQEKAPKSRTNEEKQQRIFLRVYKYWKEFHSEEPTFKISRFEKFLHDIIEVVYGFSPSDRSFEKWVKNHIKKSKN